MTYPMPENMGFPIRSISEMLPDDVMIAPVKPYTRSGKPECLGLFGYECATCGKHFEATTQHRYKIVQEKNHKRITQMFCSYSCFRPVERDIAEKYKNQTIGAYVRGWSRDKTPLERARERVETCKAKLAKFRGMKDDQQAWKSLPQRRRDSIASSIGCWNRKLEEAIRNLKEVEADEEG